MPRGAALPLALILLAVLTAIAVAAVSLSGQERVNAASYSRVDYINECATAAQAKIWAELASLGTYMGQPVAITSIRMPDGSLMTAPAHYDSTPGTTRVTDVIMVGESSSGSNNALRYERDVTNTSFGRQNGRSTYRVIAHCLDGRGRALEIELSLKFAL
jgi:Tfp pilus assembly protein PilX